MSSTRTIRQFRVGTGEDDDFSPAEMELLIYKIADWFKSPECDRSYDDPIEEAKKKVQECLKGVTSSGKMWKTCPKTFEGRIRAKTMYDMESDTGTPITKNKSPRAQRKARDVKAEKAADALSGFAAATSDFDEGAYRKKVEQDLYNEFPELNNPAARPDVRRLSLLAAQQESLDRELSFRPQKRARQKLLELVKTVQMEMERCKKLLDIHPSQLRARMDRQREGSLGDFVAMISEDKEFKDRSKMWALQFAYQLFWMANHSNGTGDEPQLHPFEIWHMTRTRPIEFTCRHGETYTIVEGFTPDELRDYLLDNGMTLSDPAVPNLIDEEDLEGIDDDPVS